MVRKRVTIEKETEVRRLLAEGVLSQAAIARRVDLTKTTVSRIANASHAVARLAGEDDDLDRPIAPPCRDRDCGCGACVTCRALEYRRERGLSPC